MESLKIAVVGAGSAGLFSASYLSQMAPDAEIHVFDAQSPGSGAMRAAAGMLAPMNELEFQELELLEAGRASLALYHSEIVPALGDIGLKAKGTLEIGLHPDDEGYLKRLHDFQLAQGLPVEWLSGDAVQEAEPLLSRNVRNAILAREDIQVDQWKLSASLGAYLRARGVRFRVPVRVRDWQVEADGVRLECEGGSEHFDKVLVAVGAVDEQILRRLPFKVYPVRGEMLSLAPRKGETPEMSVRIRSLVYGNAYVVPKDDRVLCGSTSEEKGHRALNTAGGLLDILRKCHSVLPCIYEMEVQEIWAGLRPATLTRLPVLDREAGTQVYHLNGLFRHGILLGPLMGKAAATLMLRGERLRATQAFSFPEF